jgi:glycosyltransferase involved in cell wall biosynthesis
VAAPEQAIQEVAGDAAIFTKDLADGVRRALADRARFSALGLERAKTFSWRETARITADVYRSVLAA